MFRITPNAYVYMNVGLSANRPELIKLLKLQFEAYYCYSVEVMAIGYVDKNTHFKRIIGESDQGKGITETINSVNQGDKVTVYNGTLYWF